MSLLDLRGVSRLKDKYWAPKEGQYVPWVKTIKGQCTNLLSNVESIEFLDKIVKGRYMINSLESE